jgi:hypothetical protein
MTARAEIGRRLILQEAHIKKKIFLFTNKILVRKKVNSWTAPLLEVYPEEQFNMKYGCLPR